MSDGALDGRTEATRARFCAAMALGAGLLTAWMGYHCTTHAAFEQDTIAYVIQARLFAQGMASAPAPPDRRLLPSYNINMHDGRCYSKYPPGHSLFLVPGVWVGWIGLMPSMATACTVWVVFLLVRLWYGSRAAVLAAGMCAVSPAMIGMGATTFSEPTSRLMLALYLLGLTRWLRSPGWIDAAMCGTALGFALMTRPMTALVFGVVGVIWVLWEWAPKLRAGGALPWRSAGVAVVAFLALFSVNLTWNKAHTGDAFRSTLFHQQRYDRPGFGLRGFGFNERSSEVGLFTPSQTYTRVVTKVLPSVAANALGWGVFRRSMWARAPIRPSLMLSLMLFGSLYLLALWPVLSGKRQKHDFVLWALFIGNFVAYGFFHFEGSLEDNGPLGARYYNEVTLLAFLPLLARGAFMAFDPLRAAMPRTAIVFCVFAAAMLVNTVYSHTYYARNLANWRYITQVLPGLVRHNGLRHAVVYTGFLQPLTPLNEQLLRPLHTVDVVYCVAGEHDWLNLPKEEWRDLHARLFADREPWIYDDYVPARGLRKLDLEPETKAAP